MISMNKENTGPYVLFTWKEFFLPTVLAIFWEIFIELD